MNRKELEKLLDRDDVRSRILKDGAFFDTFMGIMIGMYFTTKDRFWDFHELITDRLSFDEKARVLEKLNLKKSYKSAASMPVVRHIQQVRNLIAHEFFIHESHKKLANPAWAYLFDNYPESYMKPVKTARQRLLRLSGTKEFLEVHGQ